MSTETAKRARPLTRILIGLVVLGGCGIAIFSLMLSDWTTTSVVTGVDAEEAFAIALAECGSEPAYVERNAAGITVRRELEAEQPQPLETLAVLMWEPVAGQLRRVDVPFWFVRLKTNDTVNLGTMIATLSQDWKNLRLSVTASDLRHRGPGLVLDYTREDGARILLWTIAPAE